ncbi:MAG TPA: hypothetical protein VMA09_09305 [Candidatus Binataceae bacterium]|nr:hypothetical protein [Candidatus Binataceae bacterium]
MHRLRFLLPLLIIGCIGCSSTNGTIATPNLGTEHVTRWDNSDWWSLSSIHNINKQDGSPIWSAPSPMVLNIAGITLGPGMDTDAENKLGYAAYIERHSGGSVRQSICYRSVKEPPTAYLIFELGRASHAFYLLSADAPPWGDMGLCAKTPIVTKSISTPTGLHLGLTREQLTEMLGPPSAQHPTSMMWRYSQAPVIIRTVFAGDSAIMVSVWYADRGSGVLGD